MIRWLCRHLDYLFWKKLCCRPDGGRFHFWWYCRTGNIARFFHQFHCEQCLEEKERERLFKETNDPN